MALRKTTSGKWAATWRDPEGKQVSLVFRTKHEAEKHLVQVESQKMAGTYIDPRLGKKTLAEWWENYIAQQNHLRPTTRSTYEGSMRIHVLPHLGNRRLAALTRLDIQGWVSKLIAEGVGVASVNAAHRVLRRVLATAVESNVIGRNVAQGVKVPRSPREEMRFLNPNDIQRLASAVPGRYRGLILTLAYTGIRIGEASALRVDRLDLLRGRLQVVEAYAEVKGRLILGPTKTGATRVVTLPAFVRDALERHLTEYPPTGSPLVFTNDDGTAIRRCNFRSRVWMPALKAAGLARVRVHDLRHTSVALAIAAGAHPKEIQQRAGHSSIAITMDRYGHLFPGMDEALADRLDKLAGEWPTANEAASRVVPFPNVAAGDGS